MERIIFATHNPGKLEEMRQILKGLEIEILSAEEVGVFDDPAEDGQTFQENALKKASFVSQKTSCWAIADDSGLCIEALNGAPGVKTARWAEPDQLVSHTLKMMAGIPEGRRQAYFESAIVLCFPDGEYKTFQGLIKGSISLEARGQALPKLPYDVIFIPEGFEQTFAQMSPEQKNSLSHRGQAFRKLKKFLEKENFC